MAQTPVGVQTPKYLYLPNATVRYNKLTYTYEKDTAYETYTRPSDWLELPAVNNGDEVVYILVAVYEDRPGYIGLSVNGNFTVDWGNGDIQNYPSTVTWPNVLRTNYVLSWADYDESTITSEGYKQAIVKITPQTPGTLTRFDIGVPQSQFASTALSDILDIKMAGQNIANLTIGGAHTKLEQFEFVGTHSMTTMASRFIGTRFKKIVALDMSNVTNATSMFSGCSRLMELPSNFNTSNITVATYMFYNCTSLKTTPTLDLSSCTNVLEMFFVCTSLREVNLQNTSSVTSFGNMFYGCTNLHTVNGLNTSSATTTAGMFQSCGSLIEPPQINLQSCTNATSMFNACSSIIRFENGLINTSGVTNMSNMFASCISLVELPSDFNTNSCTTMTSMFVSCASLRRIPNINTSNVTNMSGMFNGSGILELPSSFNTSNVTNTTSMFNNCTRLLSLPTLDLSSCTTNTGGMFLGCSSLREVNLQNTSNITNMSTFFQSCTNLHTVNGLNTSSATNTSNMFNSCSKLTNIPQINLQSCTNAGYMFNACSSIIRFENGLINTSGVTNMTAMFTSCISLVEIPSTFNTNSCNAMIAIFSSCSSLKSIPNINTSLITSGASMFIGCGLEVIPPLDFSNVTAAYALFDRNPNIRKIGSIDLSKIGAGDIILRDNWSIDESNIFGIKQTHSYWNARLSRLALINVFNNLGVATSKTIDIRFNPGTSELTPSDIAIATSKGWTVTV